MKGYTALLLVALAWNCSIQLSQAALFGCSHATTTMAAVVVATMAGLIVKYNVLAPVYTPELNSLSGKTMLITGANTGLGLESAKRLAAGGANVILTTRSDAKGTTAVQAVQEFVRATTGRDAHVSYKILRLDGLSALQTAITSWDDLPTIDVLLNNAAMFGGAEPQLSEDGMEISFQTNHLGYFLVTALLKDKLSPNARIINVSSDAHKFIKQLEFDYMWNPSKEDYGFWRSYANSKLANILFTQELQRRADAAGYHWTVVALHPGIVSTDIWRSDRAWKTVFDRIVSPTMRTAEQGATTQVWLAAGGEGSVDVRGKYVVDRAIVKLDEYAQDRQSAERLWMESEAKCGLKFDLVSQQEINDKEAVDNATETADSKLSGEESPHAVQGEPLGEYVAAASYS